MKFRKIASVLASTFMVGSTVALAAAANYPAPFVNNGSADVAVVYGANMILDYDALISITNDLSSKLTADSSTTSTTVTGGDYIELTKSSNMFNLGDRLNSTYQTLDSDKLSTVLADGVYTDADGSDFDYEQKIVLGPAQLTHYSDSDVNDEVPVIGFNIASGANVLNYTLTFLDTPNNASASIEATTIDMLGREYYISDSSYTSNGQKLTLLDTANSALVNEGTATNVVVGNQSFDVAIVSVDSTNSKATLSVNGKKLDAITKGNSRKIAPDTYLSVKDLYEGTRERDVSYVEFSIGTGQIVLESGQTVQMNENAVDGLKTVIVGSAGKITSINLEWNTGEDTFLIPGGSVVMSGLEAIKIAYGSFTAPNPEPLSVRNSGNDYILLGDVSLKDGVISTLPILYANSTNDGFTGVGKDSTHRLVTDKDSTSSIALSLAEATNDRFVATWVSGDDAESFVFELQSIDKSGDINETKIKNLANSVVTTINNNGAKDIGTQLTFTVSAVEGATTSSGTETLTITPSGSGSVYADRIVTKEGLTILLPVANVTGPNALYPNNIYLNATNATSGQPTSWTMEFIEEDVDGNINALATGVTFNLSLGFSSTGPQVSTVTVTGDSGLDVSATNSDDREYYVTSPMATKLIHKTGGDQDTVDITYHGGEASASVIVSETGATISSGGTTFTSSISVKDTEVASVASKNLIVLGGSCINTVAAKILGSDVAICGADFTATTGIAAGQALIKTVVSPYSTSKFATLVAGYNAEDTAMAARYLTTNTVETSAGKEYKVTSATQATVVA